MTDRVRRTSVVVLALWFAAAALPLWAVEDVGPIRSGDSLWKIADRIATEVGFSRDQVMLALLEANPDAFSLACNVNGVLRVGAVLRVPSPESMGALDAATARRGIERQAREWAEHRRSGRALMCPAVVEQPAPESAAPVFVDGPRQAEVAPSLDPDQPSDENCPCPSDQAGSAPAVVGEPVRIAREEAPSHLPDGPLAPFWLLVPLALGLLATSLVRRKPRSAELLPEQSGAAAIAGAGSPGDAAALSHRRAPFLLAL
ncbi:FimV/HubP family polar landmark protein, partial [Thiocapsa sp.]|uniref:FimV/HubP family polar landmark protein n=1 Tax=Thiocapsa sp. TaxID=2024551 RepID=UPI002BD58640